jgi:hypothetical protein
VIAISDSRNVSINGFTSTAGSDGVTFANAISCSDWSSCRLSSNILQGAGSAAGLTVGAASLATLDGDVLQNNDSGLLILSGSKGADGGCWQSVHRAQQQQRLISETRSVCLRSGEYRQDYGDRQRWSDGRPLQSPVLGDPWDRKHRDQRDHELHRTLEQTHKIIGTELEFWTKLGHEGAALGAVFVRE